MIEFTLLATLLGLVAGSLLNLSSHPHWFVRAWDFPRVQIVAAGWLIWLLHGLTELLTAKPSDFSNWWFAVPVIGLTVWHGFRIIPYTTVIPKQAKSTQSSHPDKPGRDCDAIRLVISNVEQENDQFDQWREVIRDANPDILVVLESDDRWVDAAKPLYDDYRYRVLYPQDNWYGMMMLSRLPIEDHEIRFVVQDDIPSIDAKIRLPSGQLIRVIAVHPRPPEPWRGNHATARDAELTVWGQELANDPDPIIIGGDLNDVAWSATSRLFLRTSDLLDPRRGRGFFNTFHADYWFCRFPLDHIFHSKHFTVSGIHRLPHIGSDHFPMLIDLQMKPNREGEHRVLDEKQRDESQVELRMQRAIESDEVDQEFAEERPEQSIHG